MIHSFTFRATATSTLSLFLLLQILAPCITVIASALPAHGLTRNHVRSAPPYRFASSRNTGKDPGKRGAGSSRFTRYMAGLGACGGRNLDSDFIVAINSYQWEGGSHCHETITVTYNGISQQAQIVDECMACPYGGLDLSDGLFAAFANPALGVIYGSWSSGSSATTATTSASATTTSSSRLSTIDSSTTLSVSLASSSSTVSNSTFSATKASTSSAATSSALPTSTASVVPNPGDSSLSGSVFAQLDAIWIQFGGLAVQSVMAASGST